MALGSWRLTSCVPVVDESPHPNEAPGHYVIRLAEAKARAARAAAQPSQVIVAADTVVVDDGLLLGKPCGAKEAIRMLRRLRGHVHQVYSGLALLQVSSGRLLSDVCASDVSMRNYSDEEIETYVLSGDPLDKAGAYAIQHPTFQPVVNLKGCRASVMGLPLCHLARLFARLGLAADGDLPRRCQNHLNYSCPIWHSILGAARAVMRGEQ